MIDITFCRNYATRLKDAIAGIKYCNVVTEVSQIVKLIKELDDDDNSMLFFVIPDFPTEGRNVDDVTERVETQILVLNKTDYGDTEHDDYLDIMQTTLEHARAVKEKMISDKADFTEEGCLYMKQLAINSIVITPELHLAECNGWNVEFSFNSSE